MFGIDALINQFVFYPDRVLVANPHMVALPFQDVWLETADDMRVHGWFLPCEDAVASVLFLHGNAGNISHRLDNLRRSGRIRTTASWLGTALALKPLLCLDVDGRLGGFNFQWAWASGTVAGRALSKRLGENAPLLPGPPP